MIYIDKYKKVAKKIISAIFLVVIHPIDIPIVALTK